MYAEQASDVIIKKIYWCRACTGFAKYAAIKLEILCPLICILHVFPGTPATRRDEVNEVDSLPKQSKENKEEQDDNMPLDATNEKDDSGDDDGDSGNTNSFIKDTDSDDGDNSQQNDKNEKVLFVLGIGNKTDSIVCERDSIEKTAYAILAILRFTTRAQ